MQKEKNKANIAYAVGRKLAQRKAVAGTSSTPITREAMQEAQERLAAHRPEVLQTANFYAGVKSWEQHDRQSSVSIRQAASSSNTRRQNLPVTTTLDGVTGVNEQLVDQVEEMIEELDQRQNGADAEDDDFDQGQVIEGDAMDDAAEGSIMADEGIVFRTAWLRFLGGISHAQKRETKVLQFISPPAFALSARLASHLPSLPSAHTSKLASSPT